MRLIGHITQPRLCQHDGKPPIGHPSHKGIGKGILAKDR